MADTDNSSYITRYNLVANQVEYFRGSDWYPVAASGGTSPVVQIRVAQDTASDTISSSTFVDTTMTKTITPTSASNKIKITITTPVDGNSGSPQPAMGLKRNSTDLITSHGWFTGTEAYEPFTVVYVDSPATTSTTTYTVRARNDGTGNFTVGGGAFSEASTRTLILEEIISS